MYPLSDAHVEAVIERWIAAGRQVDVSEAYAICEPFIGKTFSSSEIAAESAAALIWNAGLVR